MASRTALSRRAGAVVRAALAIVAASLAVVPLASHAQSDDDDAPGRVGRVATYQGSLYLAPQDRASEWAEIGLNYPVTVGDNLWMSGDGRAEIDYGSGQFRLGADSNLHVSRLDDRTLALFLAQGRVIVRVRALEPGESAVIDTPNAQIELQRPGLYRIDVSPEPRQTWLIVREGEANVVLQSGLQQVLPGQTATVAGADGGATEVRNGVSVDGLDLWSADRDRVIERGARQSTAYVSRQMVGSSDLEAYGSWQTYPEYGPVWFPTTVVDDWAPYRYGRWAWLSAYGWTWVDDAPWGYAPFHYGRWAYVGGRWGWCPGAYITRPVWAPALVAWYGGGNWRFSASVGGPVYGWVPLGWREAYVPWWGRCSGRCYERYNRPYAVNLAERTHRPINNYVNAAVPGAINAVPGAAMREARPVQSSRITVPVTAVASAPVLSSAPQVRPVVGAGNRVRPGQNAPLPAGEIAARVKPLAVAPATRTDAGYSRARIMPAPGTTAVGPAHRPVAPGPVSAPPGGTRVAPAATQGSRGVGEIRTAPAASNAGTAMPQTRVAPFDAGPLPPVRSAPATVAPPAASVAAPPAPSRSREYVERPIRTAPPPPSAGPAIVPVPRAQLAPPPPPPVHAVPPAPVQHAQPAPAPQQPGREVREPRGEKPAPPAGARGPGQNAN